MKILNQLGIAAMLISLAACQQKPTDTANENTQEAVTEDDKIRYNMNPNHEAIIKSQDSSSMDSVNRDTLK